MVYWFENSLNILGYYENIYLKFSLDGRGKSKWYKNYDIRYFNKEFNDQLKKIEEIRKKAKKRTL
jgi:hypothetical protein